MSPGGSERQITHIPTQPISPAFSPDGKRIAYLDVDGMWRRSGVAVLEVATGKITQIHASIFAPRRADLVARRQARGGDHGGALLRQISRRHQPSPFHGYDGSGDGQRRPLVRAVTQSFHRQPGLEWPGLVADGTRMAAVYEGYLTVFPVSAMGEPLGPPRRLTKRSPYAPSWTGDSRHILYQSNDKLRLLDIETGEARHRAAGSQLPRCMCPRGRLVLHVGKLVDGVSKTARTDMDIVIDGNRITSVGTACQRTRRRSRRRISPPCPA
jgi:hypothetical protein